MTVRRSPGHATVDARRREVTERGVVFVRTSAGLCMVAVVDTGSVLCHNCQEAARLLTIQSRHSYNRPLCRMKCPCDHHVGWHSSAASKRNCIFIRLSNFRCHSRIFAVFLTKLITTATLHHSSLCVTRSVMLPASLSYATERARRLKPGGVAARDDDMPREH